jgi:hypothetical protein
VRDEYVRQRRGAGTRFDSDNQPKPTPKPEPKVGIGGRQGYGASSSSSTSVEQKKKTGASAPTPADLFPDVDAGHLRDWIAARKAKRLPLTETAAKGFRHAAEKAGMTVAEAVQFCAERGWAGLHADFAKPRAGPTAKPSAAANFRGTDYGTTDIDSLPADMRDAVRRELGNG